MKLVITDSGLGGLSVCAKLLQLLSEPAGANHPNYPADDFKRFKLFRSSGHGIVSTII